jgi:hypothetical protein
MTVEELIERLMEYPLDAELLIGGEELGRDANWVEDNPFVIQRKNTSGVIVQVLITQSRLESQARYEAEDAANLFDPYGRHRA